MPYDPRTGFRFGPEVTPEVRNFLRNKSLRPSFDWRDVWGSAHAHAFTVAKGMQLDVLTSIRGALQQAIEDGVPFSQFQRDLRPTLERLGWWGRESMIDPADGKPRDVQLGSPRRLRTIYSANVRTARAAGQYQRAQRTKALLPYFVYELGPSENHRLAHSAVAGTVLPVDHPFWAEWMPPNGWGCKCRLRQISAAEAERYGAAVDREPEIPRRRFVNRRTGEVNTVPRGVDPGWATNPGMERERTLSSLLSGKLEAAPELAEVAVRDMIGSWAFDEIHAGRMRGVVPVAVMPERVRKLLGAKSNIALYSDYTAEKARARHPEVTQDSYTQLHGMLRSGEISSDRDNHVVVHHRIDGAWWRAVLKSTADGREVYLQTMHRISDRHLRRRRRRSRSIED